MKIEQALSPNYSTGRGGRKIIAIVDHITAGLMPGTLSWLRNREAKASAHYLVTREGIVYQLVLDENTAWHAGIVNKPDWPLYDGTNPNRYTIGIEHEGTPNKPLTEGQYQATLELHKMLMIKYNIPPDRDHIIGHYRIDSVNRPNCPGPLFPWNRLFMELPGGQYPRSKIQVGDKLIDGFIINDRSYSPVRELCLELGKEVAWHENTNSILVLPYDGEAPLATSFVKVIVNGNIIPAKLIGDKAYCSARDLCENLGHSISWDAIRNMAIIK